MEANKKVLLFLDWCILGSEKELFADMLDFFTIVQHVVLLSAVGSVVSYFLDLCSCELPCNLTNESRKTGNWCTASQCRLKNSTNQATLDNALESTVLKPLCLGSPTHTHTHTIRHKIHSYISEAVRLFDREGEGQKRLQCYNWIVNYTPRV